MIYCEKCKAFYFDFVVELSKSGYGTSRHHVAPYHSVYGYLSFGNYFDTIVDLTMLPGGKIDFICPENHVVKIQNFSKDQNNYANISEYLYTHKIEDYDFVVSLIKNYKIDVSALSLENKFKLSNILKDTSYYDYLK